MKSREIKLVSGLIEELEQKAAAESAEFRASHNITRHTYRAEGRMQAYNDAVISCKHLLKELL